MSIATGPLDMALDEVISQSRMSRKNNNNNNSRSTRGGIQKKGGRPSRNNSFSPNVSKNTRLSTRPAAAARGPRNSLVVSNLHPRVTEKDLYELFGQMGSVKRAFLHIAPTGKSAGIADVVFAQANDAERARVTYNNVELDGRPMKISFAAVVGAVVSQPARQPARNQERRTNHPNNNNGRRGGRGGLGKRRETRPKASEQDLDAQMDSYMAVPNEDIVMN
ncbi:hypothetical protein CLU79DRAFT_774609 [Phycomyces nitens]|nr:hypothetical protein CLU79DRAFT_774609 [Phycomyces nitens]